MRGGQTGGFIRVSSLRSGQVVDVIRGGGRRFRLQYIFLNGFSLCLLRRLGVWVPVLPGEMCGDDTDFCVNACNGVANNFGGEWCKKGSGWFSECSERFRVHVVKV